MRRFLVVAALMFWQGGFTFYASIVVPVGQEVLGSHLEQGFITRVVTRYLNISGAVALGILALELLLSARKNLLPAKLLWLTWGSMVVVLVALILLHPMLDAAIDLEGHALINRAGFRTQHRIYLWVSTVEWLLAGIYIWMLLQSWNDQDRK